MGTFCLSGAVAFKAGADAPTITESQYTQAILQAEGLMCTRARFDLSGAHSTMSASGKDFLEELSSTIAAMDVIEHNMSGYPSLAFAATSLDVLRDKKMLGLQILKDKKAQDFIV